MSIKNKAGRVDEYNRPSQSDNNRPAGCGREVKRQDRGEVRESVKESVKRSAKKNAVVWAKLSNY